MVLNVVIAYGMPYDKVEVKVVEEELKEFPSFIVSHVLKLCSETKIDEEMVCKHVCVPSVLIT